MGQREREEREQTQLRLVDRCSNKKNTATQASRWRKERDNEQSRPMSEQTQPSMNAPFSFSLSLDLFLLSPLLRFLRLCRLFVLSIWIGLSSLVLYVNGWSDRTMFSWCVSSLLCSSNDERSTSQFSRMSSPRVRNSFRSFVRSLFLDRLVDKLRFVLNCGLVSFCWFCLSIVWRKQLFLSISAGFVSKRNRRVFSSSVFILTSAIRKLKRTATFKSVRTRKRNKNKENFDVLLLIGQITWFSLISTRNKSEKVLLFRETLDSLVGQGDELILKVNVVEQIRKENKETKFIDLGDRSDLRFVCSSVKTRIRRFLSVNRELESEGRFQARQVDNRSIVDSFALFSVEWTFD